MKVAISGANGFVGKNLKFELKQTTDYEIYELNRQSSPDEIEEALLNADCFVHLAGVNRPINDIEFIEGNVTLLEKYLKIIEKNEKKPSVILSSSIQAELSNNYGLSKLEAEKKLQNFSKENGNEIVIYRLPNLFGKWARPNYNSVIATFCHNISRGLEINVSDPNNKLTLNYIDDVVAEFKNAIEGEPTIINGTPYVTNQYEVTLQNVVDLLLKFKEDRITRALPNLDDDFEKALYSTYLSYLPKDKFSYPLKMNKDERGSFTEFLKTPDRGQVSINISKPGVIKGNHWHHTKNEKFLVVSGEGVIRFRLPDSDEIIEYFVSGEKLEVVDIPVGYTHNIENLGNIDMVTVMWVNEIFDPNNPDTFFLEV